MAAPLTEALRTDHRQPVPLGGTGTIVSYTVIRVAPRGRGGEVPYAIVVVRLDEGEGQTIIGFGPA